VVYKLWLRNPNDVDVTGFQAFLAFDDGAMTYEGSLSSYGSTFPLHFQDITTAETGAGELSLDGTDMFGGTGTDGDALLATLVFTVSECDPQSVTFDLGQPFDSEVSYLGSAITTSLVDSDDAVVDVTPPVITPAADVSVSADANVGDGCESAVVTFSDPAVTDSCSGFTVVCDPPSGSTFPVGTTVVTCTATDDCGNQSVDTFEVEVKPTNLLDIEVELFGTNVPASRCIMLVMDSCSVVADADLSFTDHDASGATPVRAIATVEVPCGNWTTVCAKDEQHTKWGATTSVSVSGTKYVADALVTLRPGDTDNDGDVDINDATLLIATFGFLAADGGCPWDGTRDADFDNSGSVGSEDYSLISGQWLTLSGCGCATPPGPSSGTSVATSRLETWIAERADLNRDGVVNVTDVRIFEAIHGLDGSLSWAMGLGKKSSLGR